MSVISLKLTTEDWIHFLRVLRNDETSFSFVTENGDNAQVFYIILRMLESRFDRASINSKRRRTMAGMPEPDIEPPPDNSVELDVRFTETHTAIIRVANAKMYEDCILRDALREIGCIPDDHSDIEILGRRP